MINLLYVDLFCGAGGTSTGVELARVSDEQCAKVVACVNHDKNAIASHAANHPDALHFTEDIRTLELSPLVAHVNRSKYTQKFMWYCGRHWSAQILVKRKEGSQGMQIVGRLQSI